LLAPDRHEPATEQLKILDLSNIFHI
jgi:hypothetical protein